MDTSNIVLNRLFTQNVFQDLISKNQNQTYCSVIKRYLDNSEYKKNLSLISEIYEVMSKNYRNEYIYKNSLLNILLLQKHNLKTTIALTEIPIGNSKADFILINGKAIVYEIKTDLDNFDRLPNQIFDYYKAFNHVSVVTSEKTYKKLDSILNESKVGIFVLTESNEVFTIREPIEENGFLDSPTIFKLLHKKEYENIIKMYFGSLPIATQVYQYEKCLELFKEISILNAYNLVLETLKKRSSISIEEFEQIPYELKFLVYFAKYSRKEYINLVEFLQCTYGG